MGHADEMLENAPKLKRKLKQSKQYDEVQKKIDNLTLTVIELIRTVEAIKTVMDNRKSTCSCNKTVDKDANNTQESSGDCKIDSRRDELNKELYERVYNRKCSHCKHYGKLTYEPCDSCIRWSNWESK